MCCEDHWYLVPSAQNDQKLNSWQLPFHILPSTPETEIRINSTLGTECLQRGHLLNWLCNCPCKSHLLSFSPTKFRQIRKSTYNVLNLICIFYATMHKFVIPLINWKEKSKDFIHGAQSSQSTHVLLTSHYFPSDIQSSVFRAGMRKKPATSGYKIHFLIKRQLLSQELKCQTCIH